MLYPYFLEVRFWRKASIAESNLIKVTHTGWRYG